MVSVTVCTCANCWIIHSRSLSTTSIVMRMSRLSVVNLSWKYTHLSSFHNISGITQSLLSVLNQTTHNIHTWMCHLFSRGRLAMTLHMWRPAATRVKLLLVFPVDFAMLFIHVVRGLPLGLLSSSLLSRARVRKPLCLFICPCYLSCLCLTDFRRFRSVPNFCNTSFLIIYSSSLFSQSV